jgi:hypothetical protein
MATYHVTAPDGTTYEVNGPDGASQDEVLAQVQREHLSSANADTNRASAMSHIGASGDPSVDWHAPIGQQITDFSRDLGHRVVDIPIGIGQGLVHIGNAVTQTFAPSTIANTAQRATNVADAAVAQREQEYQKTSNTPLGNVGGLIGNVIPVARGLGAMREAGMLPSVERLGMNPTIGQRAVNLAQRTKAGLVEGGVIGATAPVTSQNDNYLANKASQVVGGALVGGVLPAVVSGVKTAVGPIARLLTPEATANARIAAQLGNDPATIARLRAAGKGFPGYQPTAVEANPSPTGVQMERTLRNQPAAGVAFANADNANHAARVAVVNDIAGTPQQMELAKAARAAATQPYIEANLKPQSVASRFTAASDKLQAYLSGRTSAGSAPIIQQAQKIMQAAKNGSMQEDDAIEELNHLHASLPETPTGQPSAAMNVMQSAKDAINQGMVPTQPLKDLLHKTLNSGIASNADVASGIKSILARIDATENTRGMVSADVLDGMRQSLKSHLPINPATGQPNGQALVGLGPVKTAITNTLDAAAPGYRDYLAAYAKHSIPINTMESASRLLGRVDSGGLNSGGGEVLTLPAINQALAKDTLAQYPMAPEALAKLEAVRASLQARSALNDKITASGPGTAAEVTVQASKSAKSGIRYGLGSIVGSLISGALGLPGGYEAGLALGAAGTGALDFLNQRVAGRVVGKMANAQEAAKALEAYNAARNRLGALARYLPQGGTYATNRLPQLTKP